MTSLQVEYWKYEETKRTNQANEALRGAELQETIRHNKASEAIGWAQVGEMSRHNQATESIQQFQSETDRAHWTNWSKYQSESIAIQRDANEIAEERNRISELDANINWYRASTDRFRAEESVRQQDEELEIKRSENARKWWDSVFGTVAEASEEARGWMSNFQRRPITSAG